MVGTLAIVLEDHLSHPRYNWPLTLVRYAVQFPAGEAHVDSIKVRKRRDGQEEQMPFQLSKVVLQESYIVSGELCLYTDLPSGERQEFVVDYDKWPGAGTARVETDGLTVSQTSSGYEVTGGHWQAEIFTNRARMNDHQLSLFSLKRTGADIQAMEYAEGVLKAVSGTAVEVQVQCMAEGPLFSEFEFLCRWPDQRSYRLRLLLHGHLPLAELQEEMTGFDTANSTDALQIHWQLGTLESRYSPNRGEEPADSYLQPDGSFPMMLLPYRNWNSWWHERTIAFRSRSAVAGLFVWDAGAWNDGEYAIWGAVTGMGIECRLEEDVSGGTSCICNYPITGKSRHTAITLYGCKEQEGGQLREVERLRLWYSLLHLNKVKDWALDWEEPQEMYPRLFTPAPEYSASVKEMEKLVYEDSHNMNTVESVNPVSGREFFRWVPLFDLSAADMSEEQFRRLKACSAFMAYVHEDENLMPIRHMLAGHPNFLADVTAVHGMMAALLPNHPHAGRWRDRFERAAALNMKYHIRPAVAQYHTRGGRWTENLGCYAWAALKPMIRTAYVLGGDGDHPLLYPQSKELAQWLLHAMSAPVRGKRTYPPQGAHARLEGIPYLLRGLAQLLMRYEPQLGEQLLHVTQHEAETFEAKPEDIPWRQMLVGRWKGNSGVAPRLSTMRFTGYGIIHRAAVGTPEEMFVHLQQLDEGPNYRWGRSADGGNGVLYYYANGERYSFNGQEDVGDLNRGDGEACTSFAVIDDRNYKGIGPCELTDPTYDFTFAQYSRIVSQCNRTGSGNDRSSGGLAGKKERTVDRPYRSRSLMMSGHDYIVLYDEVADQRTKGRLSWFVHGEEQFPLIRQLLPGVPHREAQLNDPVDSSPNYSHPPAQVKGRYYDGLGDFLTVVSHRKPDELLVSGTAFGAIATIGARRDVLFRRAFTIHHEESDYGFTGRAGMIRSWNEDARRLELAIFDGSYIRFGAVSVKLLSASDGGQLPASGFALAAEGNRIVGEWQTAAVCTALVDTGNSCSGGERFSLYIDGQPVYSDGTDGQRIAIPMEPGMHRWEWTANLPQPGIVESIRIVDRRERAELQWESVPAAHYYELQIRGPENEGRELRIEAAGPVSNIDNGHTYIINDLAIGRKYIVRLRACNADQAGPWSAEYPVYGTAFPPEAPDGLRITRISGGYSLYWGRVLGAGAYRLYRREHATGDRHVGQFNFELLYEGDNIHYMDESVSAELVYEYCVAAVNGIGEGSCSVVRNTAAGGLAEWDPRPEEGFRRDPRNHEYGFSGYDYRTQDRLANLPPYPQ